MKVCIAEKPSVAKEIASIIGAKTRKDGYYEGNGYQVTWTFGHLCTLKEPEDYSPILKKWQLDTLPIIPPKFSIKLIKDDGIKKQFSTIERLVTECDEVINCGDAGQEGELIQRWVLQLAKCNKPMKRLWISSLTSEAIKEGFKNLKEGSDYDRLYWAGSSRAIGDWLLGFNATRAYTLRYAPFGSVLSIGRVQTPTLAMIVERHKEIEAFKSNDFWELKTNYREVKFSATSGKFGNKEEVNAVLEKIKESPFSITKVEQKEGKEFAPKLFDLTSLQVECNKKLNLSAEQTLQYVQGLYEKKFVSYPRVDTRFLPEDQYAKIPNILSALKQYSKLTAPLLAKPIKKSKNVFNDAKVTDHHAIIPTNVPAQGIAGVEFNVYNMITKRFIANFYPECIVSKTVVLGETNQTEFRATGRQILDAGWRVVYGKEETNESDKKEEEADQNLPDFILNESGKHKPFVEEKKTRPPKYYTEATLLRAMESAGKQIDDDELRDAMKENGIGRPSTRANIIETLFKRKYARKDKKNLIPSLTGIQLIDTIQNDLLKSAELTGQWEKKLRQVESGEYDVKSFLKEMKQMVVDVVYEVKNARYIEKITLESEEDVLAKKKAEKAEEKAKKEEIPLTCPACKKGEIIKGKSAYGCGNYKNGCRFVLPFENFGKKITQTHLKALVTKGKTPTIKGLNYNGDTIDGVLILNKEFKIDVIAKEKAPLLCPICKQANMIKGKAAYGCSRFREGCRFVVPFEYLGKTLTEAQIEKVILTGKSPLIKGFNGDKKGRIIISKSDKLEFVEG